MTQPLWCIIETDSNGNQTVHGPFHNSLVASQHVANLKAEDDATAHHTFVVEPLWGVVA